MARRAQQMVPGLRVLFTSGYTQNAIVHNGRLDEGVALLSKPYRKDDLARKLRSMLDKKDKAPPRPDAQSTSRRYKVLVVEDVALIRMTTVDMVSEVGHDTLEAATGPEALDVLAKNPDVDVLLTDLGLPGMSGSMLIQKARALRPDIAVIIASGYSTETRPGEEPPADARYLPKPFDLSQMQRVFESLRT
jgi:CheY-like chemotaxis protein